MKRRTSLTSAVDDKQQYHPLYLTAPNHPHVLILHLLNHLHPTTVDLHLLESPTGTVRITHADLPHSRHLQPLSRPSSFVRGNHSHPCTSNLSPSRRICLLGRRHLVEVVIVIVGIEDGRRCLLGTMRLV